MLSSAVCNDSALPCGVAHGQLSDVYRHIQIFAGQPSRLVGQAVNHAPRKAIGVGDFEKRRKGLREIMYL
jgi:hypothetical protein